MDTKEQVTRMHTELTISSDMTAQQIMDEIMAGAERVMEAHPEQRQYFKDATETLVRMLTPGGAKIEFCLVADENTDPKDADEDRFMKLPDPPEGVIEEVIDAAKAVWEGTLIPEEGTPPDKGLKAYLSALAARDWLANTVAKIALSKDASLRERFDGVSTNMGTCIAVFELFKLPDSLKVFHLLRESRHDGDNASVNAQLSMMIAGGIFKPSDVKAGDERYAQMMEGVDVGLGRSGYRGTDVFGPWFFSAKDGSQFALVFIPEVGCFIPIPESVGATYNPFVVH